MKSNMEMRNNIELEKNNMCLYLVWSDYITKEKFIVGKLYKNEKYVFEYEIEGVKEAEKKGFKPLVAFPNIYEKYESNVIFPAFSSRLPDKRRKDMDEILKTYGMDKYDTFELLRKSGGKLPIDNFEFIEI
ncbi:MAG: HipA N-terminal domain-containing protein [Clostridium sp.]